MRTATSLTASVIAISALVLASAPASAISTDFGIDIYMSAPTVQGTAVTGGLTSENFNSLTTGQCPATIQMGAVSGDCNVETAGDYGGASAAANDAAPTTGGVGSNYMSTANPSLEVAFDLTAPAKYLGLWWSAGTDSNVLELYLGDELVANISTSSIITLLDNSSVTTVGGGSYNSVDYFGNPRNNAASNEPFLFLSLYATGGASFDRVVLSGGGFEFDNLSVSGNAQQPASSEVPIEFIPGENAPPAPSPTLPDTGLDMSLLLGAGAIALVAGILLVRRRGATR
jgi:LPXTG-motif cell wall-anchored protein